MTVQLKSWCVEQQCRRVDGDSVEFRPGTRMKQPDSVSFRVQGTPDPQALIDTTPVDGQLTNVDTHGVHRDNTRLKLNDFEVGSADGVVQLVQIVEETLCGTVSIAAGMGGFSHVFCVLQGLNASLKHYANREQGPLGKNRALLRRIDSGQPCMEVALSLSPPFSRATQCRTTYFPLPL